MSARRRLAAFGVVGLGLAALFASYLANAQFERGLAISERNPITQAAYPWVVWTELLVVLALGLAVATAAWLTAKPAHASGPPVVGVLVAVALGAAGWILLQPSTGIAVLVLYLGVMWAGPL